MPNENNDKELDVRGMKKPDKHPTIFATYDTLSVGESFVLVNDHDPKHLRNEFETDHPGEFGWEYKATEMRNWQVKITKLASTPMPHVVYDTSDVESARPDAFNSIWKLSAGVRDLDANIVALEPDSETEGSSSLAVDVLVYVLSGSGHLETDRGDVDLYAGGVLWIPARSRRKFVADNSGLRFLTAQKRREELGLDVV